MKSRVEIEEAIESLKRSAALYSGPGRTIYLENIEWLEWVLNDEL